MRALHNRINGRILKEKIKEDPTPRTTISFYQYYQLKNPHIFRDHLYAAFQDIGILGRIYVAFEGINAQISVPDHQMENFKCILESITFLKGVRLNFAIEDDGISFFKLAIKVRNKIVADGLNDESFDVTNKGIHLKAEDFNHLANQPDTIIVDMRNHYECEVGYFENAIIPDVETFREALPYVENLLEDKKEAHIIMYCTGGIRCEKASAYYKHKGFKNVYQVEGGIIEYSRRVNELGLENKFLGKNFVFDERLGERISSVITAQCHQCGNPCDVHQNCANESCHILFIQCSECASLYENCCSLKCRDFNRLPEDLKIQYRKKVQFNGTKFGKGRFRPESKEDPLPKLDQIV